MSTLLFMLPTYLLGNLHCLGMCGPLTMMIGRHRYRYLYFFGRIFSYTLAGMIAAGLGTVVNIAFSQIHLAMAASFIFGFILMATGCAMMLNIHLPQSKLFLKAQHLFTPLILKDHPTSAFFFGFFTVLLPCGQTLMVFSACALTADIWAGLLNGSVFALLTSPSLFISMQAHQFLKRMDIHYNLLIGICGFVAGSLAFLRGLADLEIIPHWTLSSQWHLTIF